VWRALLAMSLLVENGQYSTLVSGARIEDHAEYTACMVNPFGCWTLYAARLPPSVELTWATCTVRKTAAVLRRR
jgi:hypothetical protein